MLDEFYKQYIIVIKKYREVSSGKFGAHCAHASLAASLDAQTWDVSRFEKWYSNCDQTKILKKISSLVKLNEIIQLADQEDLPSAMIPDNGVSGEVPEGTVLMGCVGPITEKEAEELGILKLSNLM